MSKQNGRKVKSVVIKSGGGIPPGRYVDGFALAQRKRELREKREKRVRGASPNKGISRIDQEDKRTHGWFVRIMRKGQVHNAFFADQTHGGKGKALELARKEYKRMERALGPVTRKAA